MKDALTALLDFYHVTRFLPFEPTTIKNLPLPVLRLLNPNFGLVVAARDENKGKVMSVMSSAKEAKSKAHSVIVSALTDPSVPPEERRIDRLLDEGETIIFAGIDTTARTLAVAMFHLLNNKQHLQKLRDQLNTRPRSADQSWSTAELEALPYMVSIYLARS